MRASLLAFLAVVSASPAAADCARPDVGPARRALDASLPKGDRETDVAPRERAAIAAMKLKLEAYVAATLACAAPDAEAKTLQKTLAAGAPKLDFAVRRVAPELTAVTAGFAIQCGSDTMLAIFRRGRAVLRAQSAPYTAVSGAWDMFDYAVAPSDKAGRWFAVTKTIAPWCSSTWSQIRTAVWRPGQAAPGFQAPIFQAPIFQAPIFQAKDPVWWGGDDLGRLAVGGGDFTIRFHAQSIDGGRHDREWVRHFQVRGDTVVRIAPVADSAQDFVEEWIQSDWKEAASWTAPSLGADVRAVHAKLHAKPYGEFGRVRPCGSGATEIEVQPDGTDGSLFFRVGQGPAFQLTGLANQAQCR